MKSVLPDTHYIQLYNKMWPPEKSTAGMMDGLLLVTALALLHTVHSSFLHLFLCPATFTFLLFLLNVLYCTPFALFFLPVISTFLLTDLYIIFLPVHITHLFSSFHLSLLIFHHLSLHCTYYHHQAHPSISPLPLIVLF